MNTSLSKSQFIKGIQCHKALWLYKNNPELRTEPDESLQAIFDSGKMIGKLAQELFPGGEEIVFEGSSIEQKIIRTKELIKQGVTTIYEATFAHENIAVMADILHKGDKGWELYEVKGSTAAKDVYVSDLSVQYFIITKSGLPLKKTSLIYLNNKYVRKGKLNIPELYYVHDLTERVKENEPSIKKEIKLIRAMLAGKCPDIDIGEHCSTPYECDFTEHCWSHVPDYSVFDIAGLQRNKKFELYRNGILRLKDVPESYPLSSTQRLQIDSELKGLTVVNKKEIKSFMSTLSYPQYYLDFETFQPPIPLYDGTRPFQQIVFQYSVHALEKKGARLKHYEFLMPAGTDGRKELAASLIKLIPDIACIITFNSSFEKGRIREMAEQFPGYLDRLMNIHDNIVDIMKPFQKKHYYTKEFRGSYSIKTVLPVLVPGLNYKGMVISDGHSAMQAYTSLHLIEDNKLAKQIIKDLLEYCKLDTLAMVKIVDKMNSLCQKLQS